MHGAVPGPISTSGPIGGPASSRARVGRLAVPESEPASDIGPAHLMIWQNTVQGDRLTWSMRGTSWDGTYALLPVVPPAWSIVGAGDFNGDGQDDIVWQNLSTGDRSIWFMSGNSWGGTFALLPRVPTEWSIAGVGDFNADGNPDLVWQNTVTGERSIWFMNGSTYSSAALLPQVPTVWSIAAVGDFNADNKPDLVWQNTATGERSIWLMNGSAYSSAAILQTVPTAWRIVAAADFDGDSKPDLVWQNMTTGERSIWLMNGPAWNGAAVMLPTEPTDWSISGVMRPSNGGTPPPSLTLQLSPFVTSGLSSPVFLAAPLNDGRVFVVQQGGLIRVVRNGQLQTTPFLDISSRVLSGGERGLLSVAFHPQYATNHYFYVYFTSQPSGDIRIERFTATSAEVADPATSKLVITAPHSANNNHNGGLLAFGPDGMLYAGLGDGGGSGDPLGNGQNFNSLLGSLLRLDVDGDDPYAIPADNPFVGQVNHRGEVWAKGLRNPWRYAFDPPTGRLFIADVGQDLWEEINVEPTTTGGLNYGWNIMEGLTCYNASTCDQTGLEPPVLVYNHSDGCSITGGYVYRGGAIPEITGSYFYSDYCSGWLRSFRYDNGVLTAQKDWGLTASAVKSFGVDAAGELYIISSNSVFKITRAP